MELPEGKPELVISHSLKNTGTKAINTQQYNHNFFSIDNDYIGDNYQLNLFFPAKYETVHPEQFREKMNFEPYAVLRDNKIIIMKDIDVEGGIFTIFSGFNDSVSENHGIVRNKIT